MDNGDPRRVSRIPYQRVDDAPQAVGIPETPEHDKLIEYDRYECCNDPQSWYVDVVQVILEDNAYQEQKDLPGYQTDDGRPCRTEQSSVYEHRVRYGIEMRVLVIVDIYRLDGDRRDRYRLLIRIEEHIEFVVVLIAPDPDEPVHIVDRKSAQSGLIVRKVMTCQDRIYELGEVVAEYRPERDLTLPDPYGEDHPGIIIQFEPDLLDIFGRMLSVRICRNEVFAIGEKLLDPRESVLQRCALTHIALVNDNMRTIKLPDFIEDMLILLAAAVIYDKHAEITLR